VLGISTSLYQVLQAVSGSAAERFYISEGLSTLDFVCTVAGKDDSWRAREACPRSLSVPRRGSRWLPVMYQLLQWMQLGAKCASVGPEGDFAVFEVAEELLPFLFCGDSVFFVKM
jgi:hypothetical protein